MYHMLMTLGWTNVPKTLLDCMRQEKEDIHWIQLDNFAL